MGRSTTFSRFLGVVLAPGSTRVPSPATGSTALRTPFLIKHSDAEPLEPTPERLDRAPNARAVRTDPARGGRVGNPQEDATKMRRLGTITISGSHEDV